MALGGECGRSRITSVIQPAERPYQSLAGASDGLHVGHATWGTLRKGGVPHGCCRSRDVAVALACRYESGQGETGDAGTEAVRKSHDARTGGESNMSSNTEST